MKNITMALAAVALILTACNKDEEAPVLSGSPVKTYTFTMQGDFSLTTSDFTRALEADGKSMTDVWVLDYMGETLVQQVHQTSEDADFGNPTLTLSLGTHSLYFIASRGNTPTLNTTDKTLSFVKVLDTFWKSLSVTVSSGGTENRAVTLDRIVTKLKILFEDAIPTGTASINITPATWYYGFNYTTGAPTNAASSQTVTVAIPSSSIGKVNESANVFGFSAASEWNTTITVVSKDGENATNGSATLTNAPFLRNRISEYSGKLWTSGNAMSMSLSAVWADSYEGTW